MFEYKILVLSVPVPCHCLNCFFLCFFFLFRIVSTQITALFPNYIINPLLTNGLSHPYHLGESTFNLRGVRSAFSFLFHFSMKIKLANRIAQDGAPRFAASNLGLFCLSMSHKKDARLMWVKKEFQAFSSCFKRLHLIVQCQ